MKFISRQLPLKATIADASDIHFGAAECHVAKLQDLVKWVASADNRFVWFKGDLIEAILPNDKRYSHCAADRYFRTPQQQADGLIKILKPIADRILFVGMGNHEYKLINTFDVTRHIASNLNVPYAGVVCVFKSMKSDGKGHFWKAYCHHGKGMMPAGAKDPIQRKANREAWVKRRLENSMFSDCVLGTFGHTHHAYVVAPTIGEEVVLTESNGKIKQTRRYHGNQGADYIPVEARWYLNSPSFLKLYGDPDEDVITYGEMAMYAPTEIGWLEIDIEDGLIAGVRKVTG